MTKPTLHAAWHLLKKSAAPPTIDALFAQDDKRAERFSFTLDGLTLDLSHTHLMDENLSLLVDLAQAQDVEGWREKMISGAEINTTEKRAVLHTALRSSRDCPPAVGAEIQALHMKMKAFTEVVRNGAWVGVTGKRIRHVVNIGIGGSDLGPRMVAKALCLFQTDIEAHFVANVDAAEIQTVLKGLDPAETLFVVVSKTFSTQETLMNARVARAWVLDALGEVAIARHFVAVSTNAQAIEAFGINPDNAFTMWDWVGGRYSVWSSVGLSVALAIGWDRFEQFLQGGAAMDRHFKTAPLSSNMPVLLALSGIFYRNFRNAPGLAILPYDERLRDLPRYLEQLDMESNGKSVTRQGEAVDYATGPIVFGDCGTVGQHSFHQWLHQGSDVILADFIGVVADEWNAPDQHNALLANMRAQSEALRSGFVYECEPYRTNPGNRPSHLLWLDEMTPYNLGLLLALYEHKVFVQGIIWDINSFDQWGVELGKKIAARTES